MLKSLRRAIQSTLRHFGYELKPYKRFSGIPDAHLYKPLFCPWDGEFQELFQRIKPYTLVTPDRCYALLTLAAQSKGTIVECGVYKGGTALLLSTLDRELHLFDTFEGMPETSDSKDVHKKGDFADTSVGAVTRLIPSAEIHQGFIPNTFGTLPERIGFAHIDVDIYQSIMDCCNHIYPRMIGGGFMVFDDYGFPSCPGARQAVDDFFADKPEKPLVQPTGQAIIFIGGN